MAKRKEEFLDLPSKITKKSWFYKDNKELCEPHLGKPYISYSTHTSFTEYFGDYVKEKLVGIDLGPKIYADFGSYVGEAIENGKFDKKNPNGFKGQENLDLTRVDGVEYEKMIIIDMGTYVIIGFIDKYLEKEDLSFIIDVKTGGANKEKEYLDPKYIQVLLYAHAIESTGQTIGGTYIEFIRREGSHVNPPLKISKDQFEIELEYTPELVGRALDTMDKTAKDVESLYKTFKKYFKK